MKLDQPSSGKLNFGDDLNSWLWPQLIPECLRENDGIHFLGIGTLLKAKRFKKQLRSECKIVIFSSGSWGTNLPQLDRRCHIYGVRGPRTAHALGLSDDMVIGDGAYLLRKVIHPPDVKGALTGFIPHHGSERYVDWQEICVAAGVRFISARQPVDSFLAEIAECKTVIAEAMHGAITADLMRIPWVAVKFAPNFREEKWLDWAESMSLELTFHRLPLVYQTPLPFWKSIENHSKRMAWRFSIGPLKWSNLPAAYKTSPHNLYTELASKLEWLAKSAPTQLSSETALEFTEYRLNKALEKLRSDYASCRI